MPRTCFPLQIPIAINPMFQWRAFGLSMLHQDIGATGRLPHDRPSAGAGGACGAAGHWPSESWSRGKEVVAGGEDAARHVKVRPSAAHTKIQYHNVVISCVVVIFCIMAVVDVDPAQHGHHIDPAQHGHHIGPALRCHTMFVT